MEYSHARSECVVYMQNISSVFFFTVCRGVQRVQRAGCGWQSLSDDWFLFGMYVCVYVRVCLEDSPYTAWLTFWKKVCVWGWGGKDKKATPLLHHILLHFCHPPFFSPSFTSLQFTPPSLSSSLLTSDTPLILPSTTTCPRGNMHCAALLLN